MNILVTGANGQLGNSIQRITTNSQDHYIFTDVCEDYQRLDITNINEIRQVVRDNKIGCIINCAAWTNVDKAEENPGLVEVLNAKAPENLAICMKEVGGVLIHISTDYVFGGAPYNMPCQENQKGTPTGVYGLAKLHGEEKIQNTGVDHVIIRTAWLYSEFGHNFVKTMLTLTNTKPQIKVVFDQCGTPTYAGDLADAIFDIVEKRKYKDHSGIYHFSNEGVCSWYDFAKMIANLAGRTTCDIQPCHSNEFPSPVKRPAYSVLDKTKIKTTFGLKIPYWLDSLQKCLNRMNDSVSMMGYGNA